MDRSDRGTCGVGVQLARLNPMRSGDNSYDGVSNSVAYTHPRSAKPPFGHLANTV